MDDVKEYEDVIIKLFMIRYNLSEQETRSLILSNVEYFVKEIIYLAVTYRTLKIIKTALGKYFKKVKK